MEALELLDLYIGYDVELWDTNTEETVYDGDIDGAKDFLENEEKTVASIEAVGDKLVINLE